MPNKRRLRLQPLVNCTLEQQMRLLDVRNDASVRSAMYDDHVIEANEHLSYVDGLKEDDGRVVLAVLDDGGRPIGALNLAGIDRANARASWGFYLDPAEQGGLGGWLLANLADIAFGALGLAKISGDAIEANDASRKLHERLGFESEGFRKGEILRDGERIGIHVFGLTADAWAGSRESVREALAERSAEPEIAFDGELGYAPTTLDQIRQIRARNNVNWMALLQMTLELSPDRARTLITEIFNRDREISALTRKLVDEA